MSYYDRFELFKNRQSETVFPTHRHTASRYQLEKPMHFRGGDAVWGDAKNQSWLINDTYSKFKENSLSRPVSIIQIISDNFRLFRLRGPGFPEVIAAHPAEAFVVGVEVFASRVKSHKMIKSSILRAVIRPEKSQMPFPDHFGIVATHF